MTPSARAAALRSTALATSLALAVGLSALSVEAWAKPKVPLPKPRPIARNAVPKQTAATNTAAPARQRPYRWPRLRPHLPSDLRHASTPPCRRRASRCRRQRSPRRHRRRNPTRTRWKTSSTSCASTSRTDATQARSRDLRSGRPQARGMADPAQRRQRRLGRALPRLRFGQSELALADVPAPADRGGAVGRPSRRRHGMVVVRKRIPDLGQGPLCAGEGDDRARRSRQCRTPGARGLAQRRHVGRYRDARRSICSARC